MAEKTRSWTLYDPARGHYLYSLFVDEDTALVHPTPTWVDEWDRALAMTLGQATDFRDLLRVLFGVETEFVMVSREGQSSMAEVKREMTVREAGRLGGQIRMRQIEAETGRDERGKIRGFVEMGKKGGAKVKELIKRGKEAERAQAGRSDLGTNP